MCEYYPNVLTRHMTWAYDEPVRDLAGFLTRESPLFTQVNNPYRPSGSSTTVRKTLTAVRVFFSPLGPPQDATRSRPLLFLPTDVR